MQAVLFVDDNLVEHDLVKFEVEEQSIRINPTFKSSAEEAIQYLSECEEGKAEFPEIIVVDIHLGGASGDEFLEEYGRIFYDKHPKVKLFYLSNSFMLPEEDEWEQFPFVKGAFEKPFTKEMFREMKRTA